MYMHPFFGEEREGVNSFVCNPCFYNATLCPSLKVEMGKILWTNGLFAEKCSFGLNKLFMNSTELWQMNLGKKLGG